MTTHRLIPPATGGKITVNGRTYNPTSSAQDVPDYDAAVLEANGWSIQAVSVATAARPINPVVGTRLYDTTAGYMIVWDGKAWRDETGTSR